MRYRAKRPHRLCSKWRHGRKRNCQSARRAAEDYDFKRLTDKLIAVIENIPEREV